MNWQSEFIVQNNPAWRMKQRAKGIIRIRNLEFRNPQSPIRNNFDLLQTLPTPYSMPFALCSLPAAFWLLAYIFSRSALRVNNWTPCQMIIAKIAHLGKMVSATFLDIGAARMEWTTRRFDGRVRNCPRDGGQFLSFFPATGQ